MNMLSEQSAGLQFTKGHKLWWSFILNLINKIISLAYLLADNGYDVWLANARGTEFSKNHRTLSSNGTQFWNFSFHEIAKYDLPAIIDHILQATNQTALHYVGHSQGTTAVLAMLSMLPQYNEKMITLHLMCPIVFLKHSGIFFRTVSAFSDQIEVISNL